MVVGSIHVAVTENSDNHDEKYMKMKFNSDDELFLNNTIEFLSMTIVVGVFLDECLYKL